MTEKGLARQPQQHSRIFPHRPKHGQVVKMFVRLPQNVDALIFELTQVFHGQFLFIDQKFRPAATGALLKASSFRAAAPSSMARRANGTQSVSEAPLPAA